MQTEKMDVYKLQVEAIKGHYANYLKGKIIKCTWRSFLMSHFQKLIPLLK